MAKRIFISQLMKDLTKEDIQPVRNAAVQYAKDFYHNEEIDFIDSYFGENYDPNAEVDGIRSIPLFFLGKSFQLLATADVVLFVGDPNEGRGTKMELLAADAYGIKWQQVTLAELQEKYMSAEDSPAE